jgi:hypothetical protein|tara:strand:- start:32 stop:295 length:264 start_codon:yes stop_codon:yes gene_type:complete
MAGKKDGITDLTKVLVNAAERFTPAQYNKLVEVIFSLMNGVQFGYDSVDGKFIKDALDIRLFHHKKNKKIKVKKKSNVIEVDFGVNK